MASLTQISIISRKFIRYGIYLFIFILVARSTFKFGVSMYLKYFPPEPPPPTVVYGKLDEIPFPEKTVPDNLKFTLELSGGALPEFPGKIEVYFMPRVPSSITVLDDAKRTASLMGFSPNGQKLVETVYAFSHSRVSSRLTINIVSGVFSVSYDLSSDQSVLDKIPPDAEEAITAVRKFLDSGGYRPKDLAGQVRTDFLTIAGGEIVPALSHSEAKITKVNLFRKPYGNGTNEYTAVTPDAVESNVWFMLGGESKTEKQIIAGEYHYYPVDEEKSSTYPLKLSQTVWEELNEGKFYLANTGDNEDGNIIIRKVYLAYYDAGQYTQYYQPVVVFEGDNNFFAYVPAVTDEYYGEGSQEEN